MAIKKAFVIKDGLEVNSDALIVSNQTKNVGIGSTIPRAKLDVSGGFIATDSYVTGISTVINKLNVGSNGSVFTVLGVGGSIGIGTALPEYLLDIRSPVSTGQTALYIKGDVNITGVVVSSNTSSSSGYATSAGIATYATTSGVSTSVSGGIASVTRLNVSGVSTFSGITTHAASLFGTAASFTGVVTALSFSGSGANLTGLPSAGVGIATAGGTVGTGATLLDFRGSGISTVTVSSGIATINITGASGGGGSVTILDDTNTDATRYVMFDDVTSGSVSTVNVSSTKLIFNPSTGTLSATQFTSLSDQTKKTNVRSIENPVEITKQLNGVRFDWIDNNKPSLGLIAQEVEKVLPELVETNSEGIKSVSYSNMVGLLIEAIKEQQVHIEELERKLNAQSV
jgi:hypothetical protein